MKESSSLVVCNEDTVDLLSRCFGNKNFLLTTSARVEQVIKWFSIMNQDRSHKESMVLMQIEYPGY